MKCRLISRPMWLTGKSANVIEILWKHVRQQQLVRTLGHWSTVVNLHWEVLYFPAVSSPFCSVQPILCGLIWFEAPRDLWDCTSGLLRISWMYGRAVHCWVKLVWMPQKVQHYCKTACSKTAPYPVHSEKQSAPQYKLIYELSWCLELFVETCCAAMHGILSKQWHSIDSERALVLMRSQWCFNLGCIATSASCYWYAPPCN